jgi:pimeloyl-ACP methyl ester carboxylesterase
MTSLPAWWSARVVCGEDLVADTGPANMESATFGGLHYWADELVYHGYRIQRHASTGHYRLLNDREDRLAWGTFEQCHAKFTEVKRDAKLPPLPKRVVLTLHGMARTRHSMRFVAQAVRERTRTPVFQLGYAATREAIPRSAQSLARVISHLEGVEEVDIVAYSMGNLVTRHWLGDLAATSTTGTRSGPRLRRYVMLGPPNNGARRAHLWAESTLGSHLFRFVMGDGGQQLGPRFDEIRERLAVPECEFGIIAGGKGDDEGWHPHIPGDDDGTVGVEETKIAGAADFAVVPVRHTWLIENPRCLEMICRFLDHGHFESRENRRPLPR